MKSGNEANSQIGTKETASKAVPSSKYPRIKLGYLLHGGQLERLRTEVALGFAFGSWLYVMKYFCGNRGMTCPDVLFMRTADSC